MATDVHTELLSILQHDLSVDATNVTSGSDLKEELGLDSVAFSIGVVAIEEKLGVRVSEEQLHACTSFGELEQLVFDLADPNVRDLQR